MRCDVIAQGIIDAARQLALKIPIVVRLQGEQTTRRSVKRFLVDSRFHSLRLFDGVMPGVYAGYCLCCACSPNVPPLACCCLLAPFTSLSVYRHARRRREGSHRSQRHEDPRCGQSGRGGEDGKCLASLHSILLFFATHIQPFAQCGYVMSKVILVCHALLRVLFCADPICILN